MKHTLVKLAALLAVLALLLTGCTQKADKLAEINGQLDALKKEMSTVLAEYDGGSVTIFDAMAPFASNYTYLYQMYSMFGMQMSEEEIADLKQMAVESEVTARALVKEFDARGLTLELTDEEIDAEVEENYKSAYDYYYSIADSEVEEEKVAIVDLGMYSEGYTRERLRDLIISQHKAIALQDAIESEITEVTEEQVRAAYDARLAADEEAYTNMPTGFETDMMDPEAAAAVCWVPEGYRTVKHVLAIPEESLTDAFVDARTALNTANTKLESLQAEQPTEERTAETIQAEIDEKTAEIATLETALADAKNACLENVKEKTDAIYADLAAGKGIDEVMAAYGEDPGMQSEPNMSTGYYVHADSFTWDSDFTAGALALANVGDYSAEPVVTGSGVHIIYYNADVTPGPIAYETVHEAMQAEALATARSEHYSANLTEIVNAINPVYHSDVTW